MVTVWRFPLRIIQGDQIIKMPEGADIVHFGSHIITGEPCVWALVNSENSLVKRTFRMYGTGHEIEIDGNYDGHVGTIFDGSFVWHFFDYGES